MLAMRIFRLGFLFLLFSITPHWLGGDASWTNGWPQCGESRLDLGRFEMEYGDTRRHMENCVPASKIDAIPNPVIHWYTFLDFL